MNLPSLPNLPAKPNIMKSKRFWVILATMVADMIIALYPDFEPIRLNLIEAVTIAGMFLAGLYGIEDVAIAFRSGIEKIKYQ